VSQTKAQLLDGSVVSVAFSAGSATAPSVYYSADTTTGIYFPGTGQVAISTGGSGRLFVDASGRVGVGTSVPNSVLHIEAPEGTAQLTIGNTALAASDGEFLAGIDFHIKDNNDTTGAVCTSIRSIADQNHTLTAKGTALAFSTTPDDTTTLTERLRIDQAGRCGIGTTTVRTPLHVKLATDKNVGFDLDGANEARILAFNDAYTSTTPLCINGEDLRFQVQGGEKARIDSSGRLLVGTSNTLVAASDEIGALNFHATDGSTDLRAAQIKAVVDGTPGANDMPGRLVFLRPQTARLILRSG
jgi:hypothetical protein